MNQELFVVIAQLKEAHDKMHILLTKVGGEAGSKVNESLMSLQRVIMTLEEANK